MGLATAVEPGTSEAVPLDGSSDGLPSVKLGLGAMTAMVIDSMVGAGVFSVPGGFATETCVLGADP